MKWFVFHRFKASRGKTKHLVNGEDVHGLFSAGVGHDAVFVAFLVQKEWLRGLAEEVHNWCASEAERRAGDPEFQGLLPVCPFERGYQKDDFKPVGDTRSHSLIQSA